MDSMARYGTPSGQDTSGASGRTSASTTGLGSGGRSRGHDSTWRESRITFVLTYAGLSDASPRHNLFCNPDPFGG